MIYSSAAMLIYCCLTVMLKRSFCSLVLTIVTIKEENMLIVEDPKKIFAKKKMRQRHKRLVTQTTR
jgi:hypothetical protein